MKIIYLICALMLIQGAAGTTGIVMNSSDYVQYKFDTNTPPTLQPGEYIIYTTDINRVLVGAAYDGNVFTNPEPVVTYSDVMVTTETLDPVTQTAISTIIGGGAAYILVRKRNP